MAYNPRHPKLHNVGLPALLESISEAHKNAQAQRTSNTGSHFIPSGNVDENGKPDGTGSIIGSGANGGSIAPWVNDTTPPGVPTGITVTSQASLILVTWDGTLQGGVPDDFDYVSVEIDGVEAMKITSNGTYPSDDSYVPGSVHDVRAKAYDNAHDMNGQPKPNASDYGQALMVTIVGVASDEKVAEAQQAAQKAIDKAVAASADASKAVTAANGKNRVFISKTEPSHDGLVKGDIWYQQDDNGNTISMKIWDGEKFASNLLLADGVFVPGSVGPVSIKDGAITAEKILASEAILDKILVRKLSADDIDVGSLSAAIIKSYKFVTPDGLNGFDESGFWTKDKEGNILFKTSNGELQAVGGLQTASSGDRIQLSQTLIKGTTVGGLQGIGNDPNTPYWLIWGDHGENGTASRLFLGTSTQQPEIATVRGNDGKSSVSLTANKVDITSGIDRINIDGDLYENGTPHCHLTPRLAFKWSSAWYGRPQVDEYTEFNQQFVVSGPGEGRWYTLDMGVRVGGPGEYGMRFQLAGSSGTYQYRLMSAALVNNNIDNFTLSKTFFVRNGTYQLSLGTKAYGNAQVAGDDNWNFCDPGITNGHFNRYLTLVEV
ncbi:MAG: hypothetical protein [Caudoviricetes sp.]|nr:MAG: hypothetical protein [Caudoviricetes sp.]